ncbi:endolytic transglycosylase MltG [Caulobacter sp. S45]|uniref:endolytic transglycosylase MltG n=1 Tax=Caulobacter sp. S45 TaxID=1641861 RepID=UPI0020B168A3|nr:endolytic transglycosylase MltG [Caulobacter sp. S45]
MSRFTGSVRGGGGLIAGTAGALVVLIVAVLAFGALSLWIYKGAGPKARNGEVTTVILRKGAGVSEIAADLQQAGVVNSAPLFLAAVQVTRAAKGLRAGEYAFPSRDSLAQVIRRIRRGDVVHHRVTIPEGLTSSQAVDVLMRTDVLVGTVAPPPEGAILPETYEVVRGEQRSAVLQRMTDARDRLVAALWGKRRSGLPFADVNQAVTMASIVEKETALDAERPKVAAVYINRLRQGMRLEADPTVIYAVSAGAPLGHGLRVSELHTASPYNTYLNIGLPPGPIANPGRASLAAVMDPPDIKALFFVADGSGGHAFADTEAEHEKNVARWRAIEKRQAQTVTLAGAPAAPPLEHR